MLNTKKLLYILPEVAYLAELLPGKKASTFKLQSFRQINGEFMDDNEFIGSNLLKLFNKLEEKEFKLILPDFLFTNTIVSVKEASDSKISHYLKEELLPDLGITTDSHQTDTTVLTEYDKQSKVQLSALEKSLLVPLQLAAEETGTKIESISPLSWTLKSLISLEPSISVTQIDSHLYLALHYIGVDQTVQTPVDKLDRLFETIKTLKGSEPSIQTLYLLSNELVEEKLKTRLSDTLPVQQLAPQQDEDSKLPSYTQKAIEAGMRTLSIEDYPVPLFELGQAPAGATLAAPEKETEENEAESETAEEIAVDKQTASDLPKPERKSAGPVIKETKEEDQVETKEEAIETESETDDSEEKMAKTETEKKETQTVEELGQPEKNAPLKTTQVASTTGSSKIQRTEEEEDEEIDALLSSLKEDDQTKTDQQKSNSDRKSGKKDQSSKKSKLKLENKKKKIIKNKDKTRTMLKMVFVTLAVFFATVGIGVGLGLGVLQLTQNQSATELVGEVEVSPSPTAAVSPSPSPSPTPEVDVAELSILVVNATTQAGYAGENADKLEEAEFGTVEAGNAQGEYEPGFYLLMSEENTALMTAVEEATDLELSLQTDKETEDPRDDYDAVLVLAE